MPGFKLQTGKLYVSISNNIDFCINKDGVTSDHFWIKQGEVLMVVDTANAARDGHVLYQDRVLNYTQDSELNTSPWKYLKETTKKR